MKIKIQNRKALFAFCLSVFLLCGFCAKSIWGEDRYLYDTLPMMYILYDPDTELEHYYYTDNILAGNMKSWEITTDAFVLVDSGYYKEAHLTADGRWIYSLITVEDSSGKSKTRLARTFTKGLTDSPAINSKKTEVLDLDIETPQEDMYPVNFTNLSDGSLLLQCTRPDDHENVVYRIDDKGPELLGEDLRMWMYDPDGSFRFVDSNDYVHWITCNNSTRKVTIEKVNFGEEYADFSEFTRDFIIQRNEEGRCYQLYRNGKTRDLGDFYVGRDCLFTPVPDSDNEFYISVSKKIRNFSENKDSSEYVWLIDDYKMYLDGTIELLTEDIDGFARSGDLCVYTKFEERNQKQQIYYKFDDGEEHVLEESTSSSFDLYRTLDGSMAVIKSGDMKYVYSINNNVMTRKRILRDSDGFLINYNTLYVYEDNSVGKFVNGEYYLLSDLQNGGASDFFEIYKDGYDCFMGYSNESIDYKVYKDGVLTGTESEHSFMIIPTAFVGNNQCLRILDQDMDLRLYLKEIGSENQRVLIPRYVRGAFCFQNDWTSDLYVRKVRSYDFIY